MLPAPVHAVQSLAEALAAAEAAGQEGLSLSADAAQGVGWLIGLGAVLARNHPDLPVTLVLDCADEAGTALGALRRGVRHIRFTGPSAVRAKLTALGAILVDAPSLD